MFHNGSLTNSWLPIYTGKITICTTIQVLKVLYIVNVCTSSYKSINPRVLILLVYAWTSAELFVRGKLIHKEKKGPPHDEKVSTRKKRSHT